MTLEDPSKYYELIVRRDLENDVVFGAPIINLEPSGILFRKPVTLLTKFEMNFMCDKVLVLHGRFRQTKDGKIDWKYMRHNSTIDKANSEVVIETEHFSLFAILLRLSRSTIILPKNIASRFGWRPFNYKLSVLVNESSPNCFLLALHFVSQDVYQLYGEDDYFSTLLQLKKEGFTELYVRSTTNQEEKSIYISEILRVSVHLGEDYTLANSEQENITFTANYHDWWNEGKVIILPLKCQHDRDVRSLCGKICVRGEHGHVSEKRFSDNGELTLVNVR